MELVRFELRIPKQLRDTIRSETAKQQEKGMKVGGRISGQYLLPVAAIQNFLSLSEKERQKSYEAAAELLEAE